MDRPLESSSAVAETRFSFISVNAIDAMQNGATTLSRWAWRSRNPLLND
jgi:hypothetical protein